MRKEIDPNRSTRKSAFELWLKVPNPMVTLFKTYDVTRLVDKSKRENFKFNALLCYCIGKSAVNVKEFYTLPIGDKLYEFDKIAVNLIVKNVKNEVSSCDVPFTDDFYTFYKNYQSLTKRVIESCENHDLTDCMVIGTSALTNVEIDGAVGMYSGVFNNPFLIWGKYVQNNGRYLLKISFQFHHTQMDGLHAGAFLKNLEDEISNL